MENLAEYLKVFIAVFVLVNPLEGIPIYLARTQDMTQAQRLAITRTTTIAIAIILWVALASVMSSCSFSGSASVRSPWLAGSSFFSLP